MGNYWDDLIFPLAAIAISIAVGLVLEFAISRWWSALLLKRGSERAASFIRSFRVLLTIWFGLGALSVVLGDFPLKQSAHQFVSRAALAVLVLSLAVLAVRLVRTFMRKTTEGHRKSAASISLVENILGLVLYAFAFLMIFRVYGVAVAPLLTALGVGGLAVALALQDTLTNFFAGIYVILSKQIDVGDYIKLSSGEEGVIEDIAWRVTTLNTSTHNLVIIPNTKISTSIVTNFDKPTRTAVAMISFTLARSADMLLFEKIALEVASDVQHEFTEMVEHVEPSLRFISISEDGITASVMLHVVEFKQQGKIRHEFLKRLFARLEKEQLLDTMFVTRPYVVREVPKPVE